MHLNTLKNWSNMQGELFRSLRYLGLDFAEYAVVSTSEVNFFYYYFSFYLKFFIISTMIL